MTTTKKAQTKPTEETPTPEAKPTQEMRFELLPVDLIDDPERPMRTDMTPQSVEDLVMSIKQVGLIEPIVVKPKNGRYEVIAGHRRKYACEVGKIAEVACYIKVVNNEETEMLKIHENLYRAEVRPSDEALHFNYLLEKLKTTPIKVAQLINKSPSYVSDRLAILNYPDFLKEAMDKGQISFSVAREFARIDDIKTMSQYTLYAIRNGQTQEGAHQWVQDYKRAKEQPQVTQQEVTDPITGQQEFESVADCFFCQTPVKLLEASVVYVHSTCVTERNKPIEQVDNTPQT